MNSSGLLRMAGRRDTGIVHRFGFERARAVVMGGNMDVEDGIRDWFYPWKGENSKAPVCQMTG